MTPLESCIEQALRAKRSIDIDIDLMSLFMSLFLTVIYSIAHIRSVSTTLYNVGAPSLSLVLYSVVDRIPKVDSVCRTVDQGQEAPTTVVVL